MPPPPKFVDNIELHGPHARRRLFELQTLAPVSVRGRRGIDEALRFKRLHYCGYRQMRLYRRAQSDRTIRREYRKWAALHQKMRNDLAESNLGLVYDLFKRSRFAQFDGDEMLSEGMMALMRAIDTFDPWRGFRFSTYACNAILRAFIRHALRETNRRRVAPVAFEPKMEKSNWTDIRRDQTQGLFLERLTDILTQDRAELTSTEKFVLSRRFPSDPDATRETLAAVGQHIQVSKERVRQIQAQALAKLRRALEEDPVVGEVPVPEPDAWVN